MISPILQYIACFFAGAFLCNSIPHLASGLMGNPFPSPFAKPPGIGNSSPVVNVLWGFLNLVIGLLLLSTAPIVIGINVLFILFLAGFLLIGLFTASHFGKVRKDS